MLFIEAENEGIERGKRVNCCLSRYHLFIIIYFFMLFSPCHIQPRFLILLHVYYSPFIFSSVSAVLNQIFQFLLLHAVVSAPLSTTLMASHSNRALLIFLHHLFPPQHHRHRLILRLIPQCVLRMLFPITSTRILHLITTNSSNNNYINSCS